MRRDRFLSVVVLVAVGLMAACSGDSPTAPKPSPTPAAVTLSLSASTTEVTAPAQATLIATVKSGGGAAADGVTVTFGVKNCSPGADNPIVFENGTCEITKTTSGGVATALVMAGASLTSPVQAEIIARASGGSASVTMAFYPGVPEGPPVLYNVIPNSGSPRGGQQVRLLGGNLGSASVQFAFTANGASVTRDAQVVSGNPEGTEITVVTPEASPNPVATDVDVDLVITNTSGTSTFNSVFTYRGESGPPLLFNASPDRGSSKGGEHVTIYGSNLLSPLKVEFNPGGVAEVVGSAEDGSWVEVITPPAQATPLGEDTPATITVTTQFGTGRDVPVTLPQGFLYLAEAPTPALYALSPNSGPIEGGTRVTITGTGFQYPVQVLFGDRQAQVESSNFNQIICIAPSINATGPTESPQTVQVTVTNIGTGKSSNGLPYRYGDAMFISSLSPGQGPDTGGTEVTIFGQGFVPPVRVTIAVAGGLDAQVLQASTTEILIKTPPVPNLQRTCAAQPGALTVTNVDSGLSTTGPAFTYLGSQPVIYAATLTAPTAAPTFNTNHVPLVGSACDTFGVGSYIVTVTGVNFETQLNGSSAMVVNVAGAATDIPATVVNDTTLTFALPALPEALLQTASCYSAGNPGVIQVATPIGLTVTNLSNGCSDTLPGALVLEPCNPLCTAALAAPTVTGVTPNSGTVQGGTPVVVTGTNFAAGSSVAFGGSDATCSFVNATSLNCTTPVSATANAGPVNVTVVNPDTQQGILAQGFTYTANVTAIFDPASTGTGTISSTPTGISGCTTTCSYDFGVASVRLLAAPDTGVTVGWGTDCGCSNLSPTTFCDIPLTTATDPVQCTVTFTAP